MAGWADYGFHEQNLGLVPYGVLLDGLYAALNERAVLCYGGNAIAYNRLSPPRDALHRLMQAISPSTSSQDSIYPASIPWWVYGTYKYHIVADPMADVSWASGTFADYYRRMNSLAGFDLEHDIPLLDPLSGEKYFRGMYRAINAIRYGGGWCGMAVSRKTDESWTREIYPKLESTSTPLTCASVIPIKKSILWMRPGDGAFPASAVQYGSVVGIVGECILADGFPAYNISQYYTFAGADMINPVADFPPPDEPTTEINLLFRYPATIIDYATSMTFFDANPY